MKNTLHLLNMSPNYSCMDNILKRPSSISRLNGSFSSTSSNSRSIFWACSVSDKKEGAMASLDCAEHDGWMLYAQRITSSTK
jgi:hypothetical protein